MSRFVKGQSGNPAGKPKGAVNPQLKMLREAADQILPTLVAEALAGNMRAVELILDRAIPRAKPQTMPEPFELPEVGLLDQVQAIMKQTAAGELSASVAGEIAALITAAGRIEEIDVLRDEVAALKAALEIRPKPREVK
ncbi:MAG: DUF5681 domain-containing protein [Candidatus Adiutrix sp.]|jgi:hypothetical protein|nr:DUF5681 domain-containing protein [Candidatus Adiutrix sp.]